MKNDGSRVCVRCVMDETAPNIVFNEAGVCNFCTDFEKKLIVLNTLNADPEKFSKLVSEIKEKGHGRKYDCIVGLSGGVDSSYVLHLVVKSGLRPLAIHLDNGWNSELAVANINSLVSSLNVDLYTHVIDWEENRNMQLSMFKAGVVDIELLMDNAMLALNSQLARRYGLRYIISGNNGSTEGIKMPVDWNHFKLDAANIKAIHKRFGSVPIKTHPLIGTVDHLIFKYINKIQWISLLDYVDYNKDAAIELLKEKYNYKPYPYKHYESVFTRYYQGFILPEKFGIDKRKVHLSSLIMSGQMKREDALQDLLKPPYDPVQLKQDHQFILKKLGVDDRWFSEYLIADIHSHDEYPTEQPRWIQGLVLWSKLKSLIGLRQ